MEPDYGNRKSTESTGGVVTARSSLSGDDPTAFIGAGRNTVIPGTVRCLPEVPAQRLRLCHSGFDLHCAPEVSVGGIGLTARPK